jgi:hypothetical protein
MIVIYKEQDELDIDSLSEEQINKLDTFDKDDFEAREDYIKDLPKTTQKYSKYALGAYYI